MRKFLKADLHIHTNNSDGEFNFLELREIIEKDWLKKVVSVADHNFLTINNSFENNWTLWIPWIEISSVANGKPVHILWYSLNPNISSNLQNILDNIIEGYNNRAKKIYNKICELGYVLPPLNSFRNSSLPPPIQKSDFIRQLGKICGFSSPREIRDWARKNWNILFVEEEVFFPDVSILLPAMHESNFITSWAHPWKQLFRSPEEELISINTMNTIISAGICGIEVFAHKHTEEQSDYFLEKAKFKKLLVTWWSDFHWVKEWKLNYPLLEDYVWPFLDKLWYI